MKFALPDVNGAWQEVSITETAEGDVKVDLYMAENVSDIIEANKKAQANSPLVFGRGTQSSMKKIGSLSTVMAYELMKKGIYQDDNALRRWFNDLDNYLWRATEKTRKGGHNAVQGS